jgi:uncharacterized protein (TIGR02145 family)
MNRDLSILTFLLILITVLGVFISACEKEESEPELVATSIVIVSGGNQTAEVSTALENPVEVIVKDQNDDAFAGTIVNFAVVEGSVSSASVTTDANGKASVSWILGTTEGTQTLMVIAFKADGTTALSDSPLTVNSTATAITVTDIDGNVYQTVKIGDQIWMAENLKTKHYANATEIILVESSIDWGALSYTDKAYCYYDNSLTNVNTYGALYTWAAAMNGSNSSSSNPSNVQGVCPSGWHLPSDKEWKQLEMYLGMSQADADDTGYRGTSEGSKLAGDANLWSNGDLENDAAFGISGLKALPAGSRHGDSGAFNSLGDNALFWNATGGGNAGAGLRYLTYSNSKVYRSTIFHKKGGRSVRCVKDY